MEHQDGRSEACAAVLRVLGREPLASKEIAWRAGFSRGWGGGGPTGRGGVAQATGGGVPAGPSIAPRRSTTAMPSRTAVLCDHLNPWAVPCAVPASSMLAKTPTIA